MNKTANHIFVISYDGLSTKDFDTISTMPHFGSFLETASYCKKVYSIYPSLTYPAHTTIVTGRYPKNHGIINNTLLQPYRESPDWYWLRKQIKGDTIYDIAVKAGMKVAALLWPVTGKSKIHYNLPEIFANRPWQNQVMVSLLNGSPIYQIELNKRFGHLRKGKSQPHLDNFVHQSLLYTIKTKKPNLTLTHYTDLDAMRHHYGFDSKEAQLALKRHDERLGEIINAIKDAGIYENSAIIILGDHSSLDENKIINLNVLLKQKGYIEEDKKGNIKSYRAIAKNCDGSAYVYLKNKKDLELAQEIHRLLNDFNDKYKCMDAVYTSIEAEKLGADPTCSFMLEASEGYYFLDGIEGDIIRKIQAGEAGKIPHVTINTHGYNPYKKDYTTIFMAAGKGIKRNVVVDNMKLIDEGPTIARLMRQNLKGADGRVIEEILE